ncbi:maleylacetoacetate isomerase [Yoonia sp. SDW83-1]|uniref:maleylacetoacetate isomerase n=1 Tax=Yoonia sp. SDW83-1 TaxID=3366945 RepID=UPI00398C511B
MTLRLHTQARNSAGERVRIALNLKVVAYEYVPIPALADEAYRALNPQQLMPAMEVDGRVLTQSLAILEYLEEAYPEPSILPADPIARARSRAFAMAICAELHAVIVKRVRKRLPTGQVDDWYGHWTAKTFAALEQMLADRAVVYPFCFADFPTFADIVLVPQMANARRFDCDLSAYPALCGIDARCQALEAFRDARPECQVDYRP